MNLAPKFPILFIVFYVLFNLKINGQGLKKISSQSSSVSYGKEIIIEAENYFGQSKTTERKWYLTSKTSMPKIRKDYDDDHLEGASQGKYLELLPDTMYKGNEGKTKKIEGKNYSNDTGKMAVLTYIIDFETPGKYFLWFRGFASSGSDNSVHVGLNDEWPNSGKQLYICENHWKKWSWSSYQLQGSEICSTKKRIFIDVSKQGRNKVKFSMREDGLEFDKFILTKNPNFRPY